jgi:threonine/homoserine/homoserine lactone efflux protein
MGEYINALILTYIAFVFAVLSPGPNVLGVLSTSLERGRSAGIFFGVGIAFGSLTWATFSVLGLSQVIAKYTLFLVIIKIFGGCYLMLLAFKAFKSSRNVMSINTINVKQSRSSEHFKAGYLLMMSNPKAALAWISIVSLSTFNNAPTWVPIAAVLGTFTLSLLIHIFYAFLFANREFVKFYGKSRSKILMIFSVVYCALGIKLLTTA